MSISSISGYTGKIQTDGWVHGSINLNENKELINRPVRKQLEPDMAISKRIQEEVSKQKPRQIPASISPTSISIYA